MDEIEMSDNITHRYNSAAVGVVVIFHAFLNTKPERQACSGKNRASNQTDA